MQLPDDAASTLITFLLHQLWTECPLIRAFSQPQQPNQNIALWILVRQESLPPAIGSIIPPEKLNGFGPDFMMDFMNLVCVPVPVSQ